MMIVEIDFIGCQEWFLGEKKVQWSLGIFISYSCTYCESKLLISASPKNLWFQSMR